MLGIKFKIPNIYDISLFKILNNIYIKNYFWKISEDEVLTENNKSFFEENFYTSSIFRNFISKEKYYPIFLNLQLYKEWESLNKNKINNYNEFLNSDCELILFITDNEFVEIYSKNPKYLNTIYDNAIKNNYNNITKIYNLEDVRKNFSSYD